MDITPVFQLGHSEYILSMAFSRDGRRLATMDEAGILKLWDVASGRLLCNLLENGCTSALAEEFFTYSADGSAILFQVPRVGTVIYDAATGRRLREVRGLEVLSAAVTSGGILAPVKGLAGIDLVDAAKGEVASQLGWPARGHELSGRAVISADGRHVAAASRGKNLVIWETASGKVVFQRPLRFRHPGVEPVFSGDGRRLAFHSSLDPIEVIDWQSGEHWGPFGGPGPARLAERFWLDENGRRLAAYLGDHVAVWEVDSGKRVFRSPKEESGEEGYMEEAAACFCPGGGVLAAWSDGNDLTVEDLAQGKRLWRAPPPPACPYRYCLCFHPRGNLLLRNSAELADAESNFNQYVAFWNVAEAAPVSSFSLGEAPLLAVEPFPDDETFLVAEEDRATRRRWADGKIVSELELEFDTPLDMALSPDGRRLLAAGPERTPLSVNLETGEEDLVFRQSLLNTLLIGLSRMCWADPFEDYARTNLSAASSDFRLHLMAVGARPNLLATATPHAGLCLWDLRTGRCVARRTLRGKWCEALTISPDGQWLAAGIKKEIMIFGMPGLASLAHLEGHADAVECLHFSPDGKWLASGGEDSAIRIWSMPYGELHSALWGHLGPVAAVKFDPSSQLLASAGNDGTLRFWDFKEGKLLHTVLDLSPSAHAVLMPDGRYRVSPGAAAFLSFTLTTDDRCWNVSLEEFEKRWRPIDP